MPRRIAADGRTTTPAARRSTARCARSRTRSCAWAASSRRRSASPIEALVAHDAEKATDGDRRRRPDQRGAAPRGVADHDDYRDPAAGGARPALPARAGPRRLRARAHGRPRRRRSPSRRASSRPIRPSRTTSTCRAWASSRPSRCGACCAPWSTSTSTLARDVAQRDDEMDDLYHRIFAEVLDLMRAGPGERRPRHAHPVRRALPRAHRRPRHQHR